MKLSVALILSLLLATNAYLYDDMDKTKCAGWAAHKKRIDFVAVVDGTYRSYYGLKLYAGLSTLDGLAPPFSLNGTYGLYSMGDKGELPYGLPGDVPAKFLWKGDDREVFFENIRDFYPEEEPSEKDDKVAAMDALYYAAHTFDWRTDDDVIRFLYLDTSHDLQVGSNGKPSVFPGLWTDETATDYDFVSGNELNALLKEKDIVMVVFMHGNYVEQYNEAFMEGLVQKRIHQQYKIPTTANLKWEVRWALNAAVCPYPNTETTTTTPLPTTTTTKLTTTTTTTTTTLPTTTTTTLPTTTTTLPTTTATPIPTTTATPIPTTTATPLPTTTATPIPTTATDLPDLPKIPDLPIYQPCNLPAYPEPCYCCGSANCGCGC